MVPPASPPYSTNRLTKSLADAIHGESTVTSTKGTSIREQFERDGYYLARGVYDAATVQDLETEFDRIVAQLQGSGEEINARWRSDEADRLGADTEILHTHNVQQFSGVWLRALLDDGLLDIAEQLLGPDIVLHHTKLFQKPPEKGAPFPLHQDWGYFPTLTDSMIAGIVHVSPATDEMGCVRVAPGSHKLGRLQGTMGSLPDELMRQYPIEEATPLEAEPGDVLFFHYFTLHGSMPNRSQATRKTVLVQMHAGDDAASAEDHPYERLVLRGWNQHATRSLAGQAK
jgi:phytanoyl-CoA hydroxylase